ncbi:hypothetical protein OB955_18695 [Halobacteria archaeon AArc-m2/3/4]|uniref:Cell division protein ZipA n=1 Tax=Natronoglomus mannanivorans TaxID=2979990 RepID=A0ABT2QIN2_9EURY|nr:hypothetical protein [Halobacteria archaeon AArc-m2/3/4]
MEFVLVGLFVLGLALAVGLFRSRIRTRVRALTSGPTGRLTTRRRERVSLVEDRRDLERRADGALEASMAPGIGTHLESPITVREVATVVTETSGESTNVALVPIVRVPLGTTDTPGMELVFDYVADVLAAVHPVFDAADDPVSHYDVQFTFGPDGLLVSGECRRVGVPVELADRLVTDSSYRAHGLRQDVESRADGEDGDEDGDENEDDRAVLWGECREY